MRSGPGRAEHEHTSEMPKVSRLLTASSRWRRLIVIDLFFCLIISDCSAEPGVRFFSFFGGKEKQKKNSFHLNFD